MHGVPAGHIDEDEQNLAELDMVSRLNQSLVDHTDDAIQRNLMSRN